ncbi:hypothetical protein, partial [Pseudomonas sp. MWU13-2100]|uniref:hypothetical protein n=1 Tax=Pseudomonas sp. MWU13-2100 TaxID=2935075 RepID=UPI00200E8784
MFKITPNPPATSNVETIDPRVADRALSHYNLAPNAGSKPATNTVLQGHLPALRNQEETLINVYSILQSAAATAYEHA